MSNIEQRCVGCGEYFPQDFWLVREFLCRRCAASQSECRECRRPFKKEVVSIGGLQTVCDLCPSCRTRRVGPERPVPSFCL